MKIGVVELEIRFTGDRNWGSNPYLSASFSPLKQGAVVSSTFLAPGKIVT
jgi:hypothetical protein